MARFLDANEARSRKDQERKCKTCGMMFQNPSACRAHEKNTHDGRKGTTQFICLCLTKEDLVMLDEIVGEIAANRSEAMRFILSWVISSNIKLVTSPPKHGEETRQVCISLYPFHLQAFDRGGSIMAQARDALIKFTRSSTLKVIKRARKTSP